MNEILNPKNNEEIVEPKEGVAEQSPVDMAEVLKTESMVVELPGRIHVGRVDTTRQTLK